ncbi:MAG: hypothetical protein WCX61_00185 [Candidatus Peribacteraceae bacterium]
MVARVEDHSGPRVHSTPVTRAEIEDGNVPACTPLEAGISMLTSSAVERLRELIAGGDANVALPEDEQQRDENVHGRADVVRIAGVPHAVAHLKRTLQFAIAARNRMPDVAAQIDAAELSADVAI